MGASLARTFSSLFRDFAIELVVDSEFNKGKFGVVHLVLLLSIYDCFLLNYYPENSFEF